MKNIKIIALVILLLPALSFAGGFGRLETVDESRARHSAENYEYYQINGRTPLGGYPEQLGDPSPIGTIRP